MEEFEVVKSKYIGKIEDNATYQLYNQSPVNSVPIDDMKILLKLFFSKAAVNMGKESHDAPDQAIEAIIEFIYKDYGITPVMFIASGFMRGSLGKYGAGRLVPNTIYKWMHEVCNEYMKGLKHQELIDNGNDDYLDLHKYPVGSAIAEKLEFYKEGKLKIEDWDKMPLKDMAERISQGLAVYPELYGIKYKK